MCPCQKFLSTNPSPSQDLLIEVSTNLVRPLEDESSGDRELSCHYHSKTDETMPIVSAMALETFVLSRMRLPLDDLSFVGESHV